MIHHGDCLDVMAGMDPESVAAIVTDPPYGINFMGKAWDGAAIAKAAAANARARKPRTDGRTASRDGVAEYAGSYDFSLKGNRAFQEWSYGWAEAAYRVAKPSAYLLAFGGTRTVHRMTCALEDAGWIIRDMLVWGYASGFPKSKASLKPAWEPIVMARKPGPLRMLAIDECRIPAPGGLTTGGRKVGESPMPMARVAGQLEDSDRAEEHPLGRWPANIVLTDPIFDGGIEGVVGGGEAGASGQVFTQNATSVFGGGGGDRDFAFYGDTGTYSRFFLIPKAARSDREPVLGGLPTALVRTQGRIEGRTVNEDGSITSHGDTRRARANVHPTVKPVDLMRHLVRLVTPTGGVILDPFLGSGTTGIAAEMEGFAWIGIEREAEYVDIANARLNGTQKGMAL